MFEAKGKKLFFKGELWANFNSSEDAFKAQLCGNNAIRWVCPTLRAVDWLRQLRQNIRDNFVLFMAWVSGKFASH